MDVRHSTSGHHRALWPYRVAEGAGLLIVIYGLASNLWWLAIIGCGIVLATYALYRVHHPKGGPDRADDGSGVSVDISPDAGDGGGGD